MLETFMMTVTISKDGSGNSTYGPNLSVVSSLGLRWYAGDLMCWGVLGTDRVKARIVVEEKRAAILAAGVWGDVAATKALFAEPKECYEDAANL